jgi:branched-subunit amino acid transport protein
MDLLSLLPLILIMAAVTYLVRMIPLVFVRRRITNRYVISFLYYIPYTVLSAMTFPAVLFGSGSVLAAAVGLAAGILAAFLERSLIVVALSACAGSLLTQLAMGLL